MSQIEIYSMINSFFLHQSEEYGIRDLNWVHKMEQSKNDLCYGQTSHAFRTQTKRRLPTHCLQEVFGKAPCPMFGRAFLSTDFAHLTSDHSQKLSSFWEETHFSQLGSN